MTSSKKGWSCSACTFLNQTNENSCELCTTPRPGREKISLNKSSNSNWTCPKCSSENNVTRSSCKICGAPSIFLTDYENENICDYCTFINDSNAKQCQVCFQPLGKNKSKKNKSRKNKNKKDKKLKKKNKYDSYSDSSSNESSSSSSSSYSNKNKKSKSHKSKYKNKSKSKNKNSNVKFVDYSDIMNKDNNKKLIKKQEKECLQLLDIYKHVYFVYHKIDNIQMNKDIIKKSFEILFNNYVESPEESVSHKNKKIKKKSKYTKYDNDIEMNDKEMNNKDSKEHKECQSCFSEFNDLDVIKITIDSECKHSDFCKDCFEHVLSLKIKEDEVTPWLLCPSPDCFERIHPRQLFSHLTPNELYKFCMTFVRMQLSRNPNWIKCKNFTKKKDKKCDFGFYLTKKEGKKDKKKHCSACGKKQTVSRNPLKDEGFKELLQKGLLRPCPKCELPTMKDKGMCNVMKCGQCGIYWNWRTKETGNSSSELKNRARMQGTLWEPGELAYQQKLQRSNLPEFIKLLERNGIKYDPNYMRGS